MKTQLPPFSRPAVASLVVAALFVVGCSDGANGGRGPAGPVGPPGSGGTPTDTQLQPTEQAPGLKIAITDLGGASLEAGIFRPGDRISVTFSLTKDDGSSWQLSELERLRALVSGPTFNYQRIIAETAAPLTEAVDNGDGTYTYTFTDPIPDNYLPPLNDSASFGPEDGELSGQALLDGTYTVGLYGRWAYEVQGETFYDVGDATFDFVLGSAGPIEPRSVAALDNCNTCHVALQAHGGQRRNLTICLMCHTSGAEDRNVPEVAGGTPGVSIDFRVMIHKIHNGEHLPSVLGVGTNPDGSRNYAATPKPYQVVGYANQINDFSDHNFPVWPSMGFPMPRDDGFSALSADQQDLEDMLREGAVACNKCHGDPDADGPLGPPDNGDLILAQPSRRACGACHDDVDFSQPYVANGQTMAAQSSDSSCKICHTPSGAPISVVDAHRHPLLDPALNPGLSFTISNVKEAGVNDGDGTLDPGEKLEATFTLHAGNGSDADPSNLAQMFAAIAGPTSNMQSVLYTEFPAAALTGSQPYTSMLPQELLYEFVGDSTAAAGEVFATLAAPHWSDKGAPTSVSLVSGKDDGLSSLSAATGPGANFIDVADASFFARDEYLVIDENAAGLEEYLKIQFVDGNRLWFSSPFSPDYAPGPRHDHASGAIVEQVTLTELVEGVDYTLDPAAGSVTEIGDFGSGAVLVSYTTDFVLPESYGLALNDSPDLDGTWGQWTGKSLVSGTYRLSLWGYRMLSVTPFAETTTYRAVSMDPAYEFLVGDATVAQSYALISSQDNCLACHQELRFHGGTRGGFDTCIACHGTAGAEDRPQYVAANAPVSTGVGVDFRMMLHKIHRGSDLANASTYAVNGLGCGYPNNFSVNDFVDVEFPVMPDGVKLCTKCHGVGNDAYEEPGDRNHPTEQGLPVRKWRGVCSSCHDSDEELAHIEVQTSTGGAESCGVCHGVGKDVAVELVHTVR